MSKSGKHAKKPQPGAGWQPDPPLIPHLMMEQMMRDFERALNGTDLEGTGMPPPSPPKELAQELAYRAMQASSPKQAIALAKQALSHDPDCVDALVLLASTGSHTVGELIVALEKAVAAGERSLGAAYFVQNKGDFWALMETRPYMRARHDLARTLIDVGRMPEAIPHFEAMLALNPNDNQGVRDSLLNCYLASGNLDGARRLLRKFREDCSAVFNWGRTLEHALSDDWQGAGKALQHARSENRFVETYLTGRKKLPRETPEYYSFGSDEEARICVETFSETWIAHPETMLRLAMMMMTANEIPGMNRRERRVLKRKQPGGTLPL